MPIKPENKDRYPADWPTIRERIRTRAGDKCEECGVVNHAWGFRDKAGEFHRVNKSQAIECVKRGNEWVRPPFYLGGNRIIEIVCTTAHLDHQPENCGDDNLRFLCQRCHLRYDQAHHQQEAYKSRRAGRAVDMFPETT